MFGAAHETMAVGFLCLSQMSQHWRSQWNLLTYYCAGSQNKSCDSWTESTNQGACTSKNTLVFTSKPLDYPKNQQGEYSCTNTRMWERFEEGWGWEKAANRITLTRESVTWQRSLQCLPKGVNIQGCGKPLTLRGTSSTQQLGKGDGNNHSSPNFNNNNQKGMYNSIMSIMLHFPLNKITVNSWQFLLAVTTSN